MIVESSGVVLCPDELAGMAVERAERLRTDAIVVQRQPALEEAAWQSIVDEVFKSTPLIVDEQTGATLLWAR